MADVVEEWMQEMVPELDDLRRKSIFDEEEIRQIVRRRRDFEYAIVQNPKPQDFLNYIRYEVALDCLRKRRSKGLHWRRKTISDFSAIKRLHGIFERGVRRFKSDLRFWYQYVDFCLRAGSTKILGKILLRAVKFHPREIRLWLLAADQELKLGKIKAARTLLLRGLRFTPKSSELFAEFLRLELQVAHNFERLELGKNVETGEKAPDRDGFELPGSTIARSASTDAQSPPAENRWAPASLLLRRALTRMDSDVSRCSDFLRTATECVEEMCAADPAAIIGLTEFSTIIHQAITERRPGAKTSSEEWVKAPAEVAVTLWELWWQRERRSGRAWRHVASEVATSAPPAVISYCALMLAEANDGGRPRHALADLAEAPRVLLDSSNVLAILESLERSVDADVGGTESAELEAAALKLLRRGAEAHPACTRLQLLALQKGTASPDAKRLLQRCSGLNGNDAVRLVALQREPMDARGIELLFRALDAPSRAKPGITVEAILADALARDARHFLAACGSVRAVALRLWDVPGFGTAVLVSLLRVKLRILQPTDVTAAAWRESFEEVLDGLDDSDPEKIEWWLRYLDFAQRVARWDCSEGLPSVVDVHWRAMRSVSDQASYSERANRLLQTGLR